MNMVHSPKTDIKRSIIPQFVGEFYRRVRANARFGSTFEGHIGDFWANVMLWERDYTSNLLQVHLAIPEIAESDFTRWLDLFKNTARRELGDEKAHVFITLARRIGLSLWIDLDMHRNPLVPRS